MPYTGNVGFMLGNDHRILIQIVGYGDLHTNDSSVLSLTNVSYTLKATTNLLSLKKLCYGNNVSVEFNPYSSCVKDLHSREMRL